MPRTSALPGNAAIDPARAATTVGRTSPGVASAPVVTSALVVGLLLPVNQLTQPGGTVAVDITDPAAAELFLDELSEEVWMIPRGSVLLQVWRLPAVLRVVTEFPALVIALVGFAGDVILRRVSLDIAGRPFAPALPRRLASLAVLALVVAVAPGLATSLASSVVLAHLGLGEAGGPLAVPSPAPALLRLTVAAVVFVFARVCRHGQTLTDEVEGQV